MSPTKLARSSSHVFKNTSKTIHQGLAVIKQDPQILIYPYLAVLVILATFPIANKIVLEIWNGAGHPNPLAIADEAPNHLRIILGLVTFYVFYTGLVTSYFTCAVSASVLARLEGHPVTILRGLRLSGKHFLEITKFALLAILFFPLGIIAQHKKLKKPRGIIDTVGGSLSLNIGQLAPAIIAKKKSVLGTIRHSMDTLGEAWHENLVIKIIMYGTLLLLASVSFLPKLVEHYWFSGETAHIVGWMITALLGVTSYILVKVLGTVFTSVLYYRAKTEK